MKLFGIDKLIRNQSETNRLLILLTMETTELRKTIDKKHFDK